jgi:hypothetical protein
MSSGNRRISILAKQYCESCRARTEHFRKTIRTEPTDNPETYCKVEIWICTTCDNVLEKRTENYWPTQREMIVKRLLKLTKDYEQIESANIDVKHDTIVLTIKLLPWSVVEAARRMVEAGEHGFYKAKDLWILQQNNASWLLENNDEIPVRRKAPQKNQDTENS